MKKEIIISAFLVIILLMPISLAESNESIEAKKAITLAEKAIIEIQNRNISINRANQTYQEAVQLYNAQKAFELTSRTADYKQVISESKEVIEIKDNALKAQDELSVFLESYATASKTINISEMDKEYNELIRSFREERFEDTLSLIDGAYKKLSEIESSQTAVKLFYQTTSASIKKFLVENWKKILTIIAIIVVSLIIFWKTLKRIILKRKLSKLTLRKESIYGLIKKIQRDYFEVRKISETEYFSKLEKFREMIREIDRQMPLIKEKLYRIDLKEKKSFGKKRV